MLLHCKSRVPFYRDLICEDTARRRPLDALAELTLANKAKIRANYLGFISSDLIRRRSDRELMQDLLNDRSNFANDTEVRLSNGDSIFLEKTSGSTGIPLKIVKSREERIIAGKSLWRLRKALDSSVSPMSLFPFEHAPLGFSFPYDLSDYSPENLRNILAEIGRRGYTWLHGHPQGIEWWAEAVLDDPSMQGLVRFSYIESNGSKLSPESRSLIQRAFACPVIDHYGCMEVWTVAYECRLQRLHVNEELILAEILGERGETISEPGRMGRLFITSLGSFAMPFLRYDLGDWVEYTGSNCDCGNRSPTIQVVPGRPNERIAGREDLFGRDVFGKVTRFLYGAYAIQYSQIRVVQTRPDTFQVYVSDFAGDRAEFTARFLEVSRALLSSDRIRIEMRFVEPNAPIFSDHPYDLFICRCNDPEDPLARSLKEGAGSR